MNISLNDRQVLRQLGHMEQTQDGRRYVNGRAMSSEAAEAIILQLANLGHVVRRNLHVWTSEQKDLCTSWRAIQKYVDNAYGKGQPGVKSKLTPEQRRWLRNHTLANPKRQLKVLRIDLFVRTHVILHISSISRILKHSGLSRQQVIYIATQRFTPSNLAYSRRFAIHVRNLRRPAFFDEFGINRSGMSNRRSNGWNVRGAGATNLLQYLKHWPTCNITGMAFMDRGGVFNVDVHTGGTDAAYVDNFMSDAADALKMRGVDGIILDNCPAHKTWQIEYYMNRRGIAVVFLPRYWPQWNPIEVCWNWLKDWLGPRLHVLQNDQTAGDVIEEGLGRVTAALARSFIQHSVIYPAAWTVENQNWNGPGPY